MRISDGLLAEKVYVTGKYLEEHGRKLKKTSRGIQGWVPWEWVPTAVDIVKDLKSKGYKIICCELTDKSVPFHKIKVPKKIVIVLGNETCGVSDAVLALVDICVQVPMLGMGNSLNMSVVAGIVGYQILTKLSDFES